MGSGLWMDWTGLRAGSGRSCSYLTKPGKRWWVLDQYGSSRCNEKWSGSGYILMMDSKEFAKELDLDREKRVFKCDFKVYGLRHKWNCKTLWRSDIWDWHLSCGAVLCLWREWRSEEGLGKTSQKTRYWSWIGKDVQEDQVNKRERTFWAEETICINTEPWKDMGLELKFVFEVQGPTAGNESRKVERDFAYSTIRIWIWFYRW